MPRQNISQRDSFRDFIYEDLMPSVLGSKCPKTINIERSFRNFLTQRDIPGASADELAEEWLDALINRLEDRCETWEGLGVPRPFCFYESPATYLTWNHPKYSDLIGIEPLPNSYHAIHKWMTDLNSKTFLVACVCLLKSISADPIYVTDGTGDAGVDCIGLVNANPMRSTVVFLQSKTSSNYLQKQEVLTEYGKYLSLPHTARFHDYLNALGVKERLDGAGYSYMIVTNTEFQDPAIRIAPPIGVLLRSGTQVAYWLSKHSSLKRLEENAQTLEKHLTRDLRTNLSGKIIL